MRRNRNEGNAVGGHPLTAQRRLLLDLLRDAGGHVDARELYRRAVSRDGSVSLATVYRSLSLFKRLGLVDERRLNRVCCCYEIRQSPEHQHLVCRGCGRVIEFRSPLIGELIESVRREHGFILDRAELCLEGYCPECNSEGHAP